MWCCKRDYESEDSRVSSRHQRRRYGDHDRRRVSVFPGPCDVSRRGCWGRQLEHGASDLVAPAVIPTHPSKSAASCSHHPCSWATFSRKQHPDKKLHVQWFRISNGICYPWWLIHIEYELSWKKRTPHPTPSHVLRLFMQCLTWTASSFGFWILVTTPIEVQFPL